MDSRDGNAQLNMLSGLSFRYGGLLIVTNINEHLLCSRCCAKHCAGNLHSNPMR